MAHFLKKHAIQNRMYSVCKMHSFPSEAWALIGTCSHLFILYPPVMEKIIYRTQGHSSRQLCQQLGLPPAPDRATNLHEDNTGTKPEPEQLVLSLTLRMHVGFLLCRQLLCKYIKEIYKSSKHLSSIARLSIYCVKS